MPTTGPDTAVGAPTEKNRALEQETREVLAALGLVGDRRHLSVVVCNLSHAPAVVESVRGLADVADVDIELIARLDGAGSDVVIRGR